MRAPQLYLPSLRPLSYAEPCRHARSSWLSLQQGTFLVSLAGTRSDLKMPAALFINGLFQSAIWLGEPREALPIRS